MIEITIPNDNISERTYAVRECFAIIGVDVNINIGATSAYIIDVGGNTLCVHDYFFSKHRETRSYLSINNIPQCVIMGRNPFTIEKDIPIIYGTDKIDYDREYIDCHIDIFASVFFMLSRWEELVVKERDVHKRFLSVNSLSGKCGFIERPVVNEYCEMLWRMLEYLGCKEYRHAANYHLILTHDIDNFRMSICKSLNDVKGVIAKTIKSRELSHIWQFLIGLFDYKYDAYNTFDFLMRKSERLGVKSHFYFMSDVKNRYIHSWEFKTTIAAILKRGHIIGFHPDRESCFNEKQWKKEKDKVEEYTGVHVTEGRQHILQIDIPYTFQIWNDNGMEQDSTLCYADKSGYRCGTGNAFHLYNVVTSTALHVKELPLVVMEGTLARYEKLSLIESKAKLDYFIGISRKYRMPLTLLFHNSSFYGKEWKGWNELYNQLEEMACQ